jgi:hypothetical protein
MVQHEYITCRGPICLFYTFTFQCRAFLLSTGNKICNLCINHQSRKKFETCSLNPKTRSNVHYFIHFQTKLLLELLIIRLKSNTNVKWKANPFRCVTCVARVSVIQSLAPPAFNLLENEHKKRHSLLVSACLNFYFDFLPWRRQKMRKMEFKMLTCILYRENTRKRD